MKKFFSLLIILLLLFTAIPVNAEPTVSITKNKSTVLVGETVEIKFTFKDSGVIGGVHATIGYDTTKLSYVSGDSSFGDDANGIKINKQGDLKVVLGDNTSTVKTVVVTIKFKALAVGETEISVTTKEMVDVDKNFIGAPDESTTISVKQENKSNNANLKWLTVPKGCTLVPKFSKDVTNYTCTVPGSVTSFPMDWEKEDPKATDVVSGALSLKVGENTRKVTVTAQDGTKKVYTVKITRLAPEVTATPELTPTPTPAPTQEPIKVTVEEQEYTLNPTISLALPDGFNKETHLYNGTEIETAVLSGIKLVQLNDGTRDMFFVYNEQTHTFSAFKQIANTNKTYTALEEKPDILPESAVSQHKVIADGEYTVWPFTQFGEGYYIIHIMNSLGEKYPAVYCEADGSVQKLSLKALETEQTGTNIEITPKPAGNFFDNLKIDWMLVAIIVCAIILVAIIVVIIVMLAKNKKMKKQEAPKRQWGFEDPYDINIDEEEAVKNETTFSQDDIDFI
ncbi:MAG: hypothetical protein E7365_06325 [Clostridiales bacterium]|nr:hypothetical protein [Clostridiales bacterium]